MKIILFFALAIILFAFTACSYDQAAYSNYVLKVLSTQQLVATQHSSFDRFKEGDTLSARIRAFNDEYSWTVNQHPIKDTTLKISGMLFDIRTVVLVRKEISAKEVKK